MDYKCKWCGKKIVGSLELYQIEDCNFKLHYFHHECYNEYLEWFNNRFGD